MSGVAVQHAVQRGAGDDVVAGGAEEEGVDVAGRCAQNIVAGAAGGVGMGKPEGSLRARGLMKLRWRASPSCWGADILVAAAHAEAAVSADRAALVGCRRGIVVAVAVASRAERITGKVRPCDRGSARERMTKTAP